MANGTYVYYGINEKEKVIFIKQIDLSIFGTDTRKFFEDSCSNMRLFAEANDYEIVDVSNWTYEDETDLSNQINNYSRGNKKVK